MVNMQDYEVLRNHMVSNQLITRGISSGSVLEAFRNVERHLYVPEHLCGFAYDDSPLPIGNGQTISQPYIVAYMTEQLDVTSGMKVLEIGTGSCYQTAILAYIGCEVYTIEYVKELADKAREKLAVYENVRVRHGDGYAGWQEEAPFDAVIVTAAPDSIPKELVKQLKDGGRMIAPVGGQYGVQYLKLISKKEGMVTEKDLLAVRFVPMVGG